MRLHELEGGFPTPEFLSYKTFQEALNKYALAATYAKNKLVLDAGSGIGYGSVYLQRSGAKQVLAGDIATSAIRKGKKIFPIEGVEFILFDITKLPFRDSSFDVVVAYEVIEHVKDYRSLLKECKRVLKEDGFFFCSTPNKQAVSPSKSTSSPFHIQEFYIEEFLNLLCLYFETIELWGQGNWLKEKIGRKLALKLRSPILRIPKGNKLVNFITKFVFRDYRLLKVEEIRNLEIDTKYQPFLLQGSKAIPVSVIAIARKKAPGVGARKQICLSEV